MSRAQVIFAGQQYGELTVIRKMPSRNGYRQWLCNCSCGAACVRSTNYLRGTGAQNQSCGCRKPKADERIRTGFRVLEWDGSGQERVLGSFGIYEKQAANLLVRIAPPQLKRRIESVYEDGGFA